MLNVQNYLLQPNKSLETLKDEYLVNYNRHKKYPNLVQLTYHHTKSPKNATTNECRALILDESKDWEVVSRSFDRFSDYNPKFNYTTSFIFDGAKYFKKIDGSIINMYYYDGSWHISTKSLPDASGFVMSSESGKTYNDYFWEVWNKKKYDFPKGLMSTYIFEFKFPGQFLAGEETSINLIGIRNRISGEETDIDTIEYNWSVCSYDSHKLEDAIAIVNEIDPVEDEGFVIMDKNFNRLKLKSPQYEAIVLLKGRFDTEDKREVAKFSDENFRRLCDIVRWNDHKTFLEKYPFCEQQYNDAMKRYKKLLNDVWREWRKVENLEGGEFTKAVIQSPYKDYIFQYKKYGYDGFEALFQDMNLNKMVDVLKKVK